MTARKVRDHVEVEEEEVRAGQTGTGVSTMLVASVILVVVGLAVVAWMMLG